MGLGSSRCRQAFADGAQLEFVDRVNRCLVTLHTMLLIVCNGSSILPLSAESSSKIGIMDTL